MKFQSSLATSVALALLLFASCRAIGQTQPESVTVLQNSSANSSGVVSASTSNCGTSTTCCVSNVPNNGISCAFVEFSWTASASTATFTISTGTAGAIGIQTLGTDCNNGVPEDNCFFIEGTNTFTDSGLVPGVRYCLFVGTQTAGGGNYPTGLVTLDYSFGPTLASCVAAEGQASTNKLYIAGSSAAQDGFVQAVANDLFGGVGSEIVFKAAGNLDFRAYCGIAAAGTSGIPAGNIVVVYYRGEGDSVVGALPIVSGKPVKQLSLTDANKHGLIGACAPDPNNSNVSTCPVSIAGASAANGPNDSFGPNGLQEAFVDFGITDVEPGVLSGVNYPTEFTAGTYGTATGLQLATLNTTPAFSQAFGFFVNNTGFTGGAALNFSTDTIVAIFNGTYTNWDEVTTESGVLASTTPVTIKIVNQVLGSGSRAAANIFLYNYGCGARNGVIATSPALSDGWSAREVLNTVAANPGAITYASIDNANAVTGATLVSLDGLVPTNLLASTGDYPFWYEATYVTNPAAQMLNANTGQDGNGTAANFVNWVFGLNELLDQASAPHTAQVGIIPGSGDNPSAGGNILGTASTLGGTTYINAFTRGGNSCAAPQPE